METENDIISSEAKLSAIAGVMFFAPFVKNKIKSDLLFNQAEKDFIEGYIKVGYTNIFFLIIVLISAILNLFIINSFLPWITIIGGLIIFIISFFSILACSNDIGILLPNEHLKQDIQHKDQILKAYTPILNFISWFRQDNYNMPYRRLKESILFRTIFIFGTLLLKTAFGIGVLSFMIIRIILLLINIDIIPINIKKAINSIFSCNPGEIMAYISAPIISKFKKSDYQTLLNDKKLGYMQGQRFGIGIILQYIIFIGILFLLHRGIDFSVNNIIIFITMALRIIRFIIFYIHKKALPKIPILSEIVSLIFH